MSTSSNDAAANQGQSDPLDRGSGTATSGGGLTNADFVPKHPTSEFDETPQPDEPSKTKIVVDDELLKPPDQRSPL